MKKGKYFLRLNGLKYKIDVFKFDIKSHCTGSADINTKACCTCRYTISQISPEQTKGSLEEFNGRRRIEILNIHMHAQIQKIFPVGILNMILFAGWKVGVGVRDLFSVILLC